MHQISQPLSLPSFGRENPSLFGLVIALGVIAGCDTTESAKVEEPATEATAPTDSDGSATKKTEPRREVGPPWSEDGGKLVEALRREPYDLEPKTEGRSELQTLIDETPDGGTVTIPEGIYPHGFTVSGRENLTIEGKPGEVWVVEHRQNHGVVRINDSHGITIEGLGLLHDPEDRCFADALQIYRSHDIVARNNDLSGSGVAGISASWSANLQFVDNHIHDATVYAADLYETANVEIRGNLIRQNPRKYEEIWRQGIHVDHVYGDIVVTRNLIVDNRSAPFTVELPKTSDADKAELSPGTLYITDNVIARNPHPDLSTIDFRIDTDEDGLYRDAAGDIVVRGNCFDTRDGRDRIQAHVPNASEVTDNTLSRIELTDAYEVTSPETCQIQIAGPVEWIERFDNRPPTPPHAEEGGMRGAECPYER